MSMAATRSFSAPGPGNTRIHFDDTDAYERTVEAFRRFDTNGDGVIDKEELGRVFKAMDPDRWDDARVSRLLALADQNGDGAINYEEFVAWLMDKDKGTRQWDADRGAAQLRGEADFNKETLIRDRRRTGIRDELIILEVDQRQGKGKLGVQVDSSDPKVLVIKGIKPDGYIAQWNSEQDTKHISVGDIIEDVNGIRDNTKGMMKELTKKLVIDVTVKPSEAAVRFVDKVSDVYDVDRCELEFGAFSTIKRATHKISKDDYCVKSIHKDRTSRSELETIASMMRGFDHPGIVKLFDVFEDFNEFHLVTEFCSGGELLERVLVEECLTERQAVRVMTQIFAAIGYLHSKQVMHRDLRAEHVLLQSNRELLSCHAKLVDFRAARKFPEEGGLFMTQVTPKIYMAPEVAKKQGYHQAADMWACGVLMYLMVGGYPPFMGDTEAETMTLVRRAALVFPEDWDSVSRDAKDIVVEMLEVRVNKRITAAEAIQHKWIENSLQSCVDFPLKKGQSTMAKFCGQNKLKKAALHAIAQRVTEEDVKELQDMFTLLDANGDNMVTFYELKAGLDRLGKEETVKDLQRMMEEIDVDGSRRIDYTEFLAATMDAKRKAEEGDIWAAFQVFDRDGTGTITREELLQVVGSQGVKDKLKSDSVDRVMQECDKDRDGTINFQEFMAMLRSNDKSVEDL